MGVLTGWTQGFYTKDRPSNKIDVAVVEATEIKEDGSIVPGASVGATPELLQLADKVGRPRLTDTKMGGGGGGGWNVADRRPRSSSRSTPRSPTLTACTTSP